MPGNCLELLKKELKKEFPAIDKDLSTYVQGKRRSTSRNSFSHVQLYNCARFVQDVLSSSYDDFEDAESVYEAIGEILHEVGGDKTEDEIRSLCVKFHMILKPESDKINSSRKILDAPVLLGQMNSNLDADIENMTSIWVQQRNDSLVSGSRTITKLPVAMKVSFVES